MDAYELSDRMYDLTRELLHISNSGGNWLSPALRAEVKKLAEQAYRVKSAAQIEIHNTKATCA